MMELKAKQHELLIKATEDTEKNKMNNRQDKFITMQVIHVLKRYSIHSVISVSSVAKQIYV